MRKHVFEKRYVFPEGSPASFLVESADELSKVIAASGLVQNLGALRALATVGIQAGHMKLHVRNMAVTAGAEGKEIDIVASNLRKKGIRITQAAVNEELKDIRIE